jgi:tRNA dimethylallyltransferase
LSELHAATAPPAPDLKFDAYAWVPADRERLYAGIESRFVQMMRDGLLDEVRALHSRADLHADLPAIRSVGYRQLWEHLSGNDGLDSAVQRAVFATRQLARRQLIWLRSDVDLQWVDALESGASAHMEQAIAALCASAAR